MGYSLSIAILETMGLGNSMQILNTLQELGINILFSLFYLVLGYLGIRIGQKIVIQLFSTKEEEKKFQLHPRKAQTLATLLVSILRYVIYFFVIMNILQRFHVDTKSILTVAGVGGVAIGFGAQNLVKDVITGFFILLEDQFGVGDLITINGMTGTVEEMGLRVTKLRDYSGALYIIPNSTIAIVTNHNRGLQKAIVDISIAYKEDINQAILSMKEVVEELSQKNEDIVTPAQVLGVQNVGPSDIVIRVVAECKTGTQWAVGREMRKLIMEKFQERNIKIPNEKISLQKTVEQDQK